MFWWFAGAGKQLWLLDCHSHLSDTYKTTAWANGAVATFHAYDTDFVEVDEEIWRQVFPDDSKSAFAFLRAIKREISCFLRGTEGMHIGVLMRKD